MERQLRSVESERLAIEREYLYWLTKTPFLGAVKIRKMWERFQSFECIYNIEEKQLRQEESLRRRILSEFRSIRRIWSGVRKNIIGFLRREFILSLFLTVIIQRD